jgi:hypothetical protein
MALRVQALWSHSRPIKLMVILLFLVNLIAPIVVVSHIYATGLLVPAKPPFTGCSIVASSNFTYMVFIPAFLYETLIIVLTVIKSYPLLRQGSITLPLSNLLFKDGLVFYFAILATQLITLICSYTGNMSLLMSITLSGPALPVSTVACNRLLMRLQSALINQDVLAVEPKSSATNASIGLWNIPVLTTDEFSIGRSELERGRGQKRQEELATNWTDIVLADLAEHQHQSPSQAPGRELRRSEEGAGQGVAR